MKIPALSIFVVTLALTAASSSSWADSTTQNGTPGAQGTEGTNPTHQESNVTGMNGGHSTDTNPMNSPASTHKKKHHKKATSTSSSTNSSPM